MRSRVPSARLYSPVPPREPSNVWNGPGSENAGWVAQKAKSESAKTAARAISRWKFDRIITTKSSNSRPTTLYSNESPLQDGDDLPFAGPNRGLQASLWRPGNTRPHVTPADMVGHRLVHKASGRHPHR